MLRWLGDLATWLSQGTNALVLRGSVDESISGRAWREDWRIRPALDWLFFWQSDHCRKAHEADKSFARVILFGDKP